MSVCTIGESMLIKSIQLTNFLSFGEIQIRTPREECFKEAHKMIDACLVACASVNQHRSAGKFEKRGIGLIDVDVIDIRNIGGGCSNVLRTTNEALIYPTGSSVVELNMVIAMIPRATVEYRNGLAGCGECNHPRMAVCLLSNRYVSGNESLLSMGR